MVLCIRLDGETRETMNEAEYVYMSTRVSSSQVKASRRFRLLGGRRSLTLLVQAKGETVSDDVNP